MGAIDSTKGLPSWSWAVAASCSCRWWWRPRPRRRCPRARAVPRVGRPGSPGWGRRRPRQCWSLPARPTRAWSRTRSPVAVEEMRSLVRSQFRFSATIFKIPTWCKLFYAFRNHATESLFPMCCPPCKWILSLSTKTGSCLSVVYCHPGCNHDGKLLLEIHFKPCFRHSRHTIQTPREEWSFSLPSEHLACIHNPRGKACINRATLYLFFPSNIHIKRANKKFPEVSSPMEGKEETKASFTTS